MYTAASDPVLVNVQLYTASYNNNLTFDDIMMTTDARLPDAV